MVRVDRRLAPTCAHAVTGVTGSASGVRWERRDALDSLYVSALVDLVVQHEAHELARERRDAVAVVVAHRRALSGGVVRDSPSDSDPGRHANRSLCTPGCQRVVETSTTSPE